jgi:hypothetical protein
VRIATDAPQQSASLFDDFVGTGWQHVTGLIQYAVVANEGASI